jgi:hypothetical protein
MLKRSTLSVVEKLLIAAYKIDSFGEKPFSAEDLVVSAWKEYPDTFGLRGYRGGDGKLKFPDSNRVFAEIMGSKPLRKRGLIVKVGTKSYQLTESGRQLARLLLKGESNNIIEKAALPREIERKLKRILESRAIQKILNGKLSEVTFFDACNFWGISPRSSAIEAEGKLAELNDIMRMAREVMKNKTVTFTHRGKVYKEGNLDIIVDVNNKLLVKFERELNIIKKRIDERK